MRWLMMSYTQPNIIQSTSIELSWPICITELKLCRLIDLKDAHLRLLKLCSHGNSLFSSPNPLQYVGVFQREKHYRYTMPIIQLFLCLLDHAYKALLANIKLEHHRWQEKPLILGRSGTQCCHGNKTVELKLWSTFSRLISWLICIF